MNGDGTPPQGFALPPRSPSTPKVSSSTKRRPPCSLEPHMRPQRARPVRGPSKTHRLLVGLALGAGLGLPGLLNVLSREAPHGGLVLVEEPSLKAQGRERVSGVPEEPPGHHAQRERSLAPEPSFPKGSAGGVGRSRALPASVVPGWRW